MNRLYRAGIPLLLSMLLAAIGLGISAVASWLGEHPSAALASHAAAFHTIGSAWLHIGAALVFATLADHIIVPWFNLQDIIHGKGKFSEYSPSDRASLARTWALLIAATILGIAWAGV